MAALAQPHPTDAHNAARHLVIRDDEHQEFEELHTSLSEELDPQGATETIIFQELLHAAWNLQRFRRIESEVSLGTLEDFTDPATVKILDRLYLYQSRAQRAREKALRELRILQTNRALRAEKLTEEQEAEVPAIVSINDLKKQTHSEVTAAAFQIAVDMMEFQSRAAMEQIQQREAILAARKLSAPSRTPEQSHR